MSPRYQDTDFGDRIEVVRHRFGETVDVFAARCGVSSTTIDAWRTHAAEPLVSYAAATALATGYSLDELADPSVPLPDAPTRTPKPVHGQLSLLSKGLVHSTGIGPRTRALLRGRRLQLKYVALDIGVSRSSLTRLVADRSEPRLTTALRLARRCEVTLEYLAAPR